ncbi:MAG TPA: carboxypeptidase regulatory-like domain-containing protein, partial [Gemmatimonadaceae bacterium]|nr:carboxypeptidase regulatory-like domain-containing protein [Gemmatimonadaceae bacterium]
QRTLVATVADESTGGLLPNAEVLIVQLQRSARTDVFGEVRLLRVPDGQYRIEARLLGYGSEVVDLPFRLMDTVRVTFLMRRIATLVDTTRIIAASIPSRMSEFEGRRSSGTGHFLTASDLTPVADLDLGQAITARIPGLRAMNGVTGQGTYLFSSRGGHSVASAGNAGGGCPVQVYRNGMRSGAPGEPSDLSDIKPQSVVGVEFYDESSTPAKYRSGNVCGVLLIWTK